jgi:hypothetical protein
MAKTTDTVAKRLAELFNSGLGAKVSAGVKELEKKIGQDANIVLPDWAGPTMDALTLNPSSIFDQAAITAFAKAGLDPKDAIHWKALMIMFSWAHFGKWPGRGRPSMWIRRWDQLLHDFYTIKNEKGNIPVIQVCRILKKRFPSRYTQTEDRLAKEVARAQDPKSNPSLAHLLEIMIEGEKRDHLRRKFDWSPRIEAEKRKAYLEMVLSLRLRKKTAVRLDSIGR